MKKTILSKKKKVFYTLTVTLCVLFGLISIALATPHHVELTTVVNTASNPVPVTVVGKTSILFDHSYHTDPLTLPYTFTDIDVSQCTSFRFVTWDDGPDVTDCTITDANGSTTILAKGTYQSMNGTNFGGVNLTVTVPADHINIRCNGSNTFGAYLYCR